MKLKYLAIVVFVLFLLIHNVAFAADSQVSGKVVDSNNNPIVNSIVTFANAEGKTVASTSTNMEGTYVLAVPKGTYTILVGGPKGSSIPQSSSVGQIISASTVRDFTLTTSLGGGVKSQPVKTQSAPNNMIIYVLAGVLVLLALAMVCIYLINNKKSKSVVDLPIGEN